MLNISNNINYFTVPRQVEIGYWFPTAPMDNRRGLSVTFVSTFYLNINQLDALNFIKSLFHASTCFEHM